MNTDISFFLYISTKPTFIHLFGNLESCNYLHFSFEKKSGAVVFRPPSVKMFMLIMRAADLETLRSANQEL